MIKNPFILSDFHSREKLTQKGQKLSNLQNFLNDKIDQNTNVPDGYLQLLSL